MTDAPTSQLYPALFSDAGIMAIVSDAAQVAAMIRVEAALARAEGAVGVIPKDMGQALAGALDRADVPLHALAQGAALAGVAVPALVAELRTQLPQEAGHWLHWGATSQDIVDTALVLTAREALGLLAERLARVLDSLEALSRRHEALPMAGRTRGQVATPITFGLKAARWAQPLVQAEAGLGQLRDQAFRVQFGGASGAGTAVAPHGPKIGAALAKELGLRNVPPWHTDRGPFRAMARWAEDVALGVARFAGDVLLLARSEIAEVTAGTGGGSSTMPQKANPVTAEAARSAAEVARTEATALSAAGVQAEERDGTYWPLEWLYLPRMLSALGAVLAHAETLAGTVQPVPGAMARTLEEHPGVMAEAASFALARQMPRAEAQARIKAALGGKDGLAAALGGIEDASRVLDPASVVPACSAEAERVWAERVRWEGSWT